MRTTSSYNLKQRGKFFRGICKGILNAKNAFMGKYFLLVYDSISISFDKRSSEIGRQQIFFSAGKQNVEVSFCIFCHGMQFSR